MNYCVKIKSFVKKRNFQSNYSVMTSLFDAFTALPFPLLR